MRKLALLPFLALAFACSDSTLVQPDEAFAPEVAATNQVVKRVPFTGEGDWWVVGLAFGCEGDGANALASGAGDPNLTHLGLSDWSFHNCWTPAFGFISQTGTFTAANGDQLYYYGSVGLGTVINYPTPNIYEIGPMWFTWGTGRFQGASGVLSIRGYVADDQLSGTVEFDGMISSVGSSK